MKVREVMSKDVLVASPDDTIEKAATLMAQADCGVLPVGENDRLVGMVTDRDITLRAVAKGQPPDRCKVRDVMSSGIKYVFDDQTTNAAAKSMSDQQVHRLPVLNRQKRLVGIVSLGDLAWRQSESAAKALHGISKPNGAIT
jgi:CBS domain-containing protein